MRSLILFFAFLLSFSLVSAGSPTLPDYDSLIDLFSEINQPSSSSFHHQCSFFEVLSCKNPSCNKGQNLLKADYSVGRCCDICCAQFHIELFPFCNETQYLDNSGCTPVCTSCPSTLKCPVKSCPAGQELVKEQDQCCPTCKPRDCNTVDCGIVAPPTFCPAGQYLVPANFSEGICCTTCQKCHGVSKIVCPKDSHSNDTTSCNRCCSAVPKNCVYGTTVDNRNCTVCATSPIVNPNVTLCETARCAAPNCNSTEYVIPSDYPSGKCCETCGECSKIRPLGFDVKLIQFCGPNQYSAVDPSNPLCIPTCHNCTDLQTSKCKTLTCPPNQVPNVLPGNCCPTECKTRPCFIGAGTCVRPQCKSNEYLADRNVSEGWCCPHCVACPTGQIANDTTGQSTTCKKDCSLVKCKSPDLICPNKPYHFIPTECCAQCCNQTDFNACPKIKCPTGSYTPKGSCCPTCLTCPVVSVDDCPHGFVKDKNGCNVCRKCDPRLECSTPFCKPGQLQHGCCGNCTDCTKEEKATCSLFDCARGSNVVTLDGKCCPTCCPPTTDCPHGVTNNTDKCPTCCPAVNINVNCTHGFEKAANGCNVCKVCPRLGCLTPYCKPGQLQHGCCGGCTNCTADEKAACPFLPKCVRGAVRLTLPGQCCPTCCPHGVVLDFQGNKIFKK
jgi:hypothetical protein